MCGIWCCLGNMHLDVVMRCLKTLEPRGPEETRSLYLNGVGYLGFTRLALNGLTENGMQPMHREKLTWVCNGEIYNWKELAAQYNITTVSGSDCEVLGPLYERFCELEIPLEEFFRALDGVFALILVDEKRGRTIVGRDPYGVRPLYRFFKDYDHVIFGSEMKSLIEFGVPEAFPPGHYQIIDNVSHAGQEKSYHEIPFLKNPHFIPEIEAMMAVRSAFTAAVEKRLMTDRNDIAVTLSGGLDSSLVAALANRERLARGQSPIQTFSIGMHGSTDLFYAKLVAEYIGSVHTEIIMTADEFFDAIPYVIRDIESFDTTTVRASVGNWLVAKWIREHSDCKIVLNGDGSDEVWGSYLYFNNAPSDHAYEAEVGRLLKDIHMFDVLRSDRCISSHGLEPRTPFLDKQFVAVARSIPTLFRRPVKGFTPEKYLLRRAFEGLKLLPEEVLWRRKEAFSDGVSGEKSWYEITQEKALEKVGVQEPTSEKFYYRKLYREFYRADTESVNVPYFWMPRWSPGTTDPSARTLAVYVM